MAGLSFLLFCCISPSLAEYSQHVDIVHLQEQLSRLEGMVDDQRQLVEDQQVTISQLQEECSSEYHVQLKLISYSELS